MKKFLSVLCMIVLVMTVMSAAAFADEDDGLVPGGEEPLGLAPGGDDLLGAAPGNEEDIELPMPFEFKAPEYVFLDRTSDLATVQTVNLAFSFNQSMREFLALGTGEARDAINSVGLATLNMTAQIDWAIDDPEAWHYSEAWDNDGKNEKGQVVVGDWAWIGIELEGDNKKVQSVRIFPDFGDPKAKDNTAWNGSGNIKGYKSIIPAEILKTDEENGHYYIDWTEHTLYVRVRFKCVTEDNDEEFMKNTYFTDWSEVVSYGKDVEEYYPYENETALPKPELSNLTVETVDPDEGPVLKWNTSLPADFLENAIRTEVYGGVAHLIYSVRLNQTGDWKNIYEDVISGEYTVPINSLLAEGESYAEGDAVEVNAMVWIDQYLGIEGDWVGSLSGERSEIITYGIDEEPEVTPTPETTPTPEATPTPTLEPLNIPTPVVNPQTEDDEDVCPICHNAHDPQIFGVCMYIWGGGFILLIILISIIVKIVRRKQDEKTDILFR